MSLVTVASFDNVEEAFMAKNRLANEGVPSFIEEGAVNALLPHNTVFESKLQVAEDWADRARHILREVDREKLSGQ